MTKQVKSKSYRINLVDALMALILVLLVAVAYFSIYHSKSYHGRPMTVTVEVQNAEQSQVVFSEASHLGKAYLNSINKAIEVTKVDKSTGPDGKITAIYITLKGKGDISKNRIIFNGARILIGQKAEVHANYFAQGIISDVRYAD